MSIKGWIDSGHGGKDSGATGNGMLEKNINLSVGLEVIRLLKLNGFTIGASRTSDVYLDLAARCNMAKKFGAQFLISIHHNAGGGDGYEVIHSIHTGLDDKLANLIAAEFKTLGQNPHNVGVYSKPGTFNKKADYYGMIRQMYPITAVICEYGYIDTSDSREFDTKAEQMNEAAAIARAVCKFYNIPFKTQTATAVQQVQYKKGIVTADVLNCRSLPYIKGKVIKQLKKDTPVTIYKEQGIWYLIDSKTPMWVCRDYVKII